MKLRYAFAAFLMAGASVVSHAAEADPAKAPAGAYALDRSHASVTGTVSHLGLSDFTFQFSDFDASYSFDPAKPLGSTLRVVLRPASVRTGVAKLDEELAGERFFNTAQYPEISFVSTSIVPRGSGAGTVRGKLTMMGRTQDVEMPFTYNGSAAMGGAQKMGFSATLIVNRSDYGMTALVGPVGDTVKLAIETEFVLKK